MVGKVDRVEMVVASNEEYQVRSTDESGAIELRKEWTNFEEGSEAHNVQLRTLRSRLSSGISSAMSCTTNSSSERLIAIWESRDKLFCASSSASW